MSLFLKFVSFFGVVATYLFLNVVILNYIFLQTFPSYFSCIPGFKGVVFKYKMEMVDYFQIFLIIWKTKESTLSIILWNESLRNKVRIPSYSDLHFLAFGLNTERYGVSLRIQSECGKIRTLLTQ